MINTSPMTIRCPLLIGRDDLLEHAERRLEDVAAGRGQFLLIAGEAGIGKTRLQSAIRNKAEARGLPTAVASLTPQDRDVPAASILDLARAMTRMPVFAELGRGLLRLSDATLTAEHVHRRRLVMDTVDQILSALPGPTMLAFEDLQWADELSLEIVGELARQSRDRPVMLTGDYRIEDVVPGTSIRDWRARLVTQRIAEEVRLKPLTRSETALVTTLIMNTGLPAPRDVSAAVFERTDGFPLHIEELLGALSGEARASGKAILEATVPDTIDDAILARIGHRSDEAQAVARAGAVIGRCFVAEVLAGIMDLAPSALDGPLQELVDHQILSAPVSDTGYYDFRHQSLRDVLYRTIPASERRRFHARAGEFGTQLDGASEVHASVHYERAGLHRQAFDAAVTGAREAVRLSAHREAFDLYRRAVANAPDDLDDGQRGELLEAYAGEAGAIEENDICEQASRDASLAFVAAGRPAKAIAMLDAVLSIWRREGRSLVDRYALVETALKDLASLPPDAERVDAEMWMSDSLARIQLDAMELDAARSTFISLREAGLSLGDRETLVQSRADLATIDVLDGQVTEGLDDIAAAAFDAQRAGFESTAVSAFRNAGLMAIRTMDYRRAELLLAEGMRYAGAIEQSHCLHVMSATSALVGWASGEWDTASGTARQTVADHGCRRASMMARWTVGFVALGRGDHDTADSELSVALAIGSQSGSVDLILPPLWGLAESALLAGDPDLAIEHCRVALERALAVGERAFMAPFVVTGVRAFQAAGRPAEAEAWLASCTEHLSPMAVVTTPALEHGRGLVALAAGATGVARLAFAAAIAGWDERGRNWEATWARLDLANCLTRLNRFAEAVELATAARAVASRLDSRPLADRADALQRLARGHVAMDEPWRPLTAREFAVARLITEGMTNAEIAHELSIAPKTASSHVEHILAKLGASRRAEIAAWATAVDHTPPVVRRGVAAQS